MTEKKVVTWIQNLVEAGYLQYAVVNDELVCIRGPKYDKAPEHFRKLFEGPDIE